MSVMYEVTGYDRKTGDLVTFYDVPERRIASVKNIARVPSTDDGLGSYPLDHDQVADISRILETEIQQGDLDYFLEAYDESTNQSAAR
jgi:hypothetical protein